LPLALPGAFPIGCWNAGMNLTLKQFLRDFAFTCAAAIGTGVAVGGVSAMVVLILARGAA
jgi:hypothetical protein